MLLDLSGIMGLRGLLVGAGGLSLLVLSTSSLGVEAFVPSAGFSRQRSAGMTLHKHGAREHGAVDHALSRWAWEGVSSLHEEGIGDCAGRR